MKQINIKKNGILTNSASFPSDSELSQWFERHKEMKTFGENAYSYQQEATPAVIDETGVEISPAVFETVEVAAEYEYEIVDITSEIEQEAINKEALAYLAATDWYVTRFTESGVQIPEEIKAARAEARARIVK